MSRWDRALSTKSAACFAAAAPYGARSLLTRLSTCLHSTVLSLRGNELGPEGGAALAEGLKGNSLLQSLE